MALKMRGKAVEAEARPAIIQRSVFGSLGAREAVIARYQSFERNKGSE
jgi:hypothetical protein